MFKSHLKRILARFKTFKGRKEVLKESIKKKLEYSYEHYVRQMQPIVNDLETRSNYKVLRQLGKKPKDKEKMTDDKCNGWVISFN